jgi:ribosomal protein S6--L-glutamate ligase
VLGLGHNLVVQQYVKKTGQDVRVLVVGGKALAAVRRLPRMGHLSHTLIKGARLERIELTDACRVTAERTARLVGLEVAAVDLLDVKGQPKVFEVNSSPALPEMEAATGMDFATPIIERGEALVAGAPPVERQDLGGGEAPKDAPVGQRGSPRRKATGRPARKVSSGRG